MKLHKAETGERYSDDSGWERRISIDLKSGKLEIELEGAVLNCHPRELTWLMAALTAVNEALLAEF